VLLSSFSFYLRIQLLVFQMFFNSCNGSWKIQMSLLWLLSCSFRSLFFNLKLLCHHNYGFCLRLSCSNVLIQSWLFLYSPHVLFPYVPYLDYRTIRLFTVTIRLLPYILVLVLLHIFIHFWDYFDNYNALDFMQPIIQPWII